jgi:hypothetical protein
MAKAPGKLSTKAAEFLRDTTDGPPVRDREGISIGTVNILWAGQMPPWTEPSSQREDEPITVTATQLKVNGDSPATLAERVKKPSR